ncbi:MAG: ATP-binding protein [Desulfovibrionaceae bacterium]|nr:ATP-binding protein [Desulfovibrionaceae bacterium]
MAKIHPLPAARLHTSLDPVRIPWGTSEAIPRGKGNGGQAYKNLLQPRAVEALELAMHIDVNGYNVYLSGEPYLGRSYITRAFLAPRARKSPTPDDMIYVSNFVEPDSPRLIMLPSGKGRKVKQELADSLQKVHKEIPARFEADAYVRERSRIMNKFQEARSSLLTQMNSVAGDKGFNLDVDEGGSLTLYPLIEGRRLDEDEYDKLDSKLRLALKRKGDSLLHAMTGLVRQLSRVEEDWKEDERSLDRQVVTQVLDSIFDPAQERINKLCPVPALAEHLFEVREDILRNPEPFLPKDVTQPEAHSAAPASESGLTRYEINLFVDNSRTEGAPVIFCDHPTLPNLMGCVERQSEMGALVTDFTLIKAGALHKAHGGFLVLHVDDLLQHPAAWEGLLRALKSGLARIEEPGEQESATRTKGIEPEALQLQTKVILIGDEELYESLLLNDDRFGKLFRIKAHLTETAERNATCIRIYLQRLAGIIDDLALLPFDREALAELVNMGSRLIEDQKKLSLRFPRLREIMIEASARARMERAQCVTADILKAADEARMYRNNLVEEAFMEEYDRRVIKVRTSGSAVGRVNGLAVTYQGDFEFGLPHQIACTIGVGHDGIIDLEREAELGGPIHTKAMMILKSYLTGQFARTKPLVLSGSLCFEQSYAGIEGDSASAAELAALLSSIAEVPVRLDLAFTGAVSQSGQIMAVGGVSRKIEGFFKVCARHGLTGSQGVIIPYDNQDQLLLAPRVRQAVAEGMFAIYPVQYIEEALELLTGIPAGRRLKTGHFSKGSLYDKVDRRLEALGRSADTAFKRRRSA